MSQMRAGKSHETVRGCGKPSVRESNDKSHLKSKSWGEKEKCTYE